jgi:hypothetical protein
LPRVCFLTGNRATGKAEAINFSTITPQEAAANPAFLRFCGPDDLRAAGHLDSAWGQWFTDGLKRAGHALGLTGPPDPRNQVIALPGLAPAAGAAPPVEPTIVPGGQYTMRSPDGKLIAIVPGYQVGARLAEGWTLV